MDPKQISIEQLVVNYFQQRGDTPIRFESEGRYYLQLESESARLFFGRGQKTEMMLTFDSDVAYNYPNSELVTANHPFLDVIRNELESREDQDPRISEAFIPAHVLSPDGKIETPTISVHGRNSKLAYRIRYWPSILFTYRILYETDSVIENIVRLCLDADTGAVRSDLLLQLHEELWQPGSPTGNQPMLLLRPEQILQTARQEIEKVVNADLCALNDKQRVELDNERQRLYEHFNNECKKITEDTEEGKQLIEQLRFNRDREIQEFERRFSSRATIKLLSMLILWWPLVEYKITAVTARGSFDIEGIRYDSRIRKTEFKRCERCGNEQKYSVCDSGKHVCCAGECNDNISECTFCHDKYCHEHGGPCRECGLQVCVEDRSSCKYGKHSSQDFFCPQCYRKSFEDEVICVQCAQSCEKCERIFPHELIATCRVGGEQICFGHGKSPDGDKCQDCGEICCKDHGQTTADHQWACQDHVEVSSCCSQVYTRHSLRPCISDPNERLCSSHTTLCTECGGSLCEKHRLPLTRHKAYVCTNCRKGCEECPEDRNYLKADLKACKTCSKVLCPDHVFTCVVGHETLCKSHMRTSINGEILCSTHAAECSQPHQGVPRAIFRRDTLSACVICKNLICNSHRITCPTCQSTIICSHHQSTQPKCECCGRISCGANGCSSKTFTCKSCHRTYCRHCMGKNGECRTCSSLKPFALTQEWINYIKTLPPQIAGGAAGALESAQKLAGPMTIYEAKNNTYQIVLAICKPRTLEFWKSEQRIRVVIHRVTNQTVAVYVE